MCLDCIALKLLGVSLYSNMQLIHNICEPCHHVIHAHMNCHTMLIYIRQHVMLHVHKEMVLFMHINSVIVEQ